MNLKMTVNARLNSVKWVVLMLAVYCCGCGDSMRTRDSNHKTNFIQQEPLMNTGGNSPLVTEQSLKLELNAEENLGEHHL